MRASGCVRHQWCTKFAPMNPAPPVTSRLRGDQLIECVPQVVAPMRRLIRAARPFGACRARCNAAAARRRVVRECDGAHWYRSDQQPRTKASSCIATAKSYQLATPASRPVLDAASSPEFAPSSQIAAASDAGPGGRPDLIHDDPDRLPCRPSDVSMVLTKFRPSPHTARSVRSTTEPRQSSEHCSLAC